MQFTLNPATCVVAPALCIFSPDASTTCCEARSFATQSHLEHISHNYLDIWNGNLALINTTLSPAISVHADRFPSPTGVGSVQLTISSSTDFAAFVERARSGWEKYTFVPYKWIGAGNEIAVRWRLEAIMGSDFALIPTTLKPGDPLTYNGTDYLVLNEQTGLIDEAHITQDLITLFHNLGLTSVTV